MRDLASDQTYRLLETGLFVTLTNVNFDPSAIKGWIDKTARHREALKAALSVSDAAAAFPGGPAAFAPASSIKEAANQGR